MTLAHPRQAAAAAAGAGWLTARARSWQHAAAAWLARPGKTAQAVAAGIPVGPGERVLTLDHGPGGSLIAATAAAVYLADHSEPGRRWCRLGWEQVTRAAWDGQRAVLVLTGAGPGGVWRKELALARHRPLVDLARERVTATLLASAAVHDGDQVCAVVMARRLPGSGKVLWVTLLNEASRTGDQAARAKAAAAIAGLRAQTGIPAE